MRGDFSRTHVSSLGGVIRVVRLRRRRHSLLRPFSIKATCARVISQLLVIPQKSNTMHFNAFAKQKLTMLLSLKISRSFGRATWVQVVILLTSYIDGTLPGAFLITQMGHSGSE